MSRGRPVLTLGRPVSALSRIAEHPVSWIRRSTHLDIGANGDGDSQKKTYKARFITNSSSCTTTELSKLLTSCLTAVKNHVIRYCEKVYERSGKNLFWSIKTSGEVLNKLKSRGFRATSLSTYDFSTLYTTLPHNLIKEKLINLIEWTFKRECLPYIACKERQASSLLKTQNDINLHADRTTECFEP